MTIVLPILIMGRYFNATLHAALQHGGLHEEIQAMNRCRIASQRARGCRFSRRSNRTAQRGIQVANVVSIPDFSSRIPQFLIDPFGHV